MNKKSSVVVPMNESNLIVAMLTKKQEAAEAAKEKEKNFDTYHELMLKSPIIDVWKLCRSGNLESLTSYIRTENQNAKESVVMRRDREGCTGLHYACREGHLHCVKYLLFCNADTTVENCCGWTPLHFAASNGHLEVLLELIEPPDSSRGTPDHLGFTPLHEAIRHHHIDCVKALVTPGPSWPGANKDACSNLGTTPLHLAAHLGHIDVVAYLLEAGAAPITRNRQKLTAVDIAKTTEIAELIKAAAKIEAKKIRADKWKKFLHGQG